MKTELNSITHSDFSDITQIFNVEKLQQLQDLFSDAHQVASIITYPNGEPITKASGFTRFCFDYVRKTQKGLQNCMYSDSCIGKFNPDGPTVQRCLSGGLWDAGVSIKVGNKHLGNWLIGQIRTKEIDEAEIENYAVKIGIDPDSLIKAYRDVPLMTESRFRKIADMFYAYVNELTENAYQTILVKNTNNEINQILNSLPEVSWRFEWDTEKEEFVNPFISNNANELLLLQPGNKDITFEEYFSHVLPEYAQALMEKAKEIIANPSEEYTIVYEAVKSTGERISLESTARAIYVNGVLQVFGVTKEVTEKLRLERELKENKRLLEKIVDNYPNSYISIIENDFTIGFTGGAEFNKLGLEAEVFIGLTLEDVFDEQADLVKKYYERTFKGENCEFELFINRKYQKYKTVPLYSNGREVNRILVVVENITSQKKAQQNLIEAKKREEESRKRLELAMQVTLDGPWDWNLKTNEIYFSDRWKDILGYKPYELENSFSVWEKLINPEHLKQFFSLFNQHIQGEKVKFEFEFQMCHKSGKWIDIRSRAKALFNEDGEAYRVVGTHIDITKEKEIKQSLAENEQRFRELTEHLPSGVAVYKAINDGEDFVFVDLNAAAKRITKHKKEDLLGKTLLSCFPNLINSPLLKSLRKVYNSGEEAYIPPFYYDDKELEGGWRENSIYKLPSGEIVAIFKDVTDLKLAQERLKKKNKKLRKAKIKAEESEQLKTAFLTNMSHEIRTPMNGILGFIDLLQTPGLSEDEKSNYAEIINQSGRRLLDTINDIIDYSKIETGDILLNPEEINVLEIFQNQACFFELEAKSKNLNLKFVEPENAHKVKITADKNKLESVLTNLLKNAIKFTNEGDVEFGFEIVNNKLKTYVKDTGVGIPKEKLTSIFERFVQADLKITRGHEGSGLGLAICKAYVEKMGGKIEVKSEMGKGSTFEFTIGIVDPHANKDTDDNVTFGENLKNDMEKKADKDLILVAEDDKTSFLFLDLLLKKLGFDVLHAENGIDAVNKYFDTPGIALILMDLKMPKLDGLQATMQIRGVDPAIPIIAQTAFVQPSVVDEVMKAGCNDYIPKPIIKEKLVEVLSKYVLEKV